MQPRVQEHGNQRRVLIGTMTTESWGINPMLRKLQDLRGYAIRATDGLIGKDIRARD